MEEETKKAGVRSPPNPPRHTLRTTLPVRGTQPDQMISLMNKDRVSYLKMVERVIDDKHQFCCSTVSYISNSILHIQSDTYLGGVPRFLIKIEDTMRFTTFHMGKNKFSLKNNFSLRKNKICVLVSWSGLEKTVRYLNCHEETSKTQIL